MKITYWVCVLFAVWNFWGCEDSDSRLGNDWLIRVGGEICTVTDFNRAFEIAKTAYADGDFDDPGVLSELRRRILRESMEELIVLKRSGELEVTVSEGELETAVALIRRDYPEDSFERMLLENSISFAYWKERLRRKMLRDRVLALELEKNVTVGAAEIQAFYDSHLADAPGALRDGGGEAAVSRRIVGHVRREKAREKYPDWIKSLRLRYNVEINEAAWSGINGTSETRSEK